MMFKVNDLLFPAHSVIVHRIGSVHILKRKSFRKKSFKKIWVAVLSVHISIKNKRNFLNYYFIQIQPRNEDFPFFRERKIVFFQSSAYIYSTVEEMRRHTGKMSYNPPEASQKVWIYHILYPAWDLKDGSASLN